MTEIKKIVKCHKFVLTDYLMKIGMEYNLSLNEFLTLVFLDNNYNESFDLSLMSKILNLNESVCLESFNNLMQKKLVSLSTIKDEQGKMKEIVNLEGIYESIEEDIIETTKEEEKESIFSIFEREFGRPLSSMEIEIIKAWLENGTSEEMVIGALKEATYNGVSNLRYIDKIIYEWGKKKFRTMKDVEENSKRRKEEPVQTELFDYDWTNDYD